MYIDERGYWKPLVFNSPALSIPKTSKAVAAHEKKENNVPFNSLII
jgi:hypothetical protein